MDSYVSYVTFTEVAMLIMFGMSWPFNIAKSFRSKTAKGKSVLFEIIIVAAYLVGVSGKLVNYRITGNLHPATYVYFIDIVMVTIDIVLYIRNTIYDKIADTKAQREKAEMEQTLAQMKEEKEKLQESANLMQQRDDNLMQQTDDNLVQQTEETQN